MLIVINNHKLMARLLNNSSELTINGTVIRRFWILILIKHSISIKQQSLKRIFSVTKITLIENWN